MRIGLAAGGLMVSALVAPQVWAAPPAVEVVGLFRDHAVVRFGGRELTMTAGDDSGGLKLVSADSRRAVFEWRGERFAVGLSGRVGATFKAVEETRVSLMRDGSGQYRARGTINGQPVDMLVDTGASSVAISSAQAARLGIPIDPAGERAVVYTAQGETPSHVVRLDRVAVGGIELRNVEAVVIEGQYPVEILLGMSFLRQVTLEENAGVLTLKRRY